MIAAGIVEFAVGATAILGVFVALAAFIEKVWAPAGKWLQKWFTTPVSRQMSEMRDEFVDFRDYVRYHLGPNSNTTPIHRRLERLESAHNIEDEEDAT